MKEREFPVSGMNLDFIEKVYVDYLNSPTSVPESFRRWFDSLELEGPFEQRPRLGPTFGKPPTKRDPIAFTAAAFGQSAASEVTEAAVRQERLAQLVRAFRERGHEAANLDPLGLLRPGVVELEPEAHGLSSSDLERQFSAATIGGPDVLTLRQVLDRLRNTYCRSIGVQFMHIGDAKMREWLRSRMEETTNRASLSRDEQLRILTKLTDAVIFEEFLQTKYIGAKVFSLEGSESLIPLLTFAIDRAGNGGVDEIVLAMAHRGRLNVLANIMGKSPRKIFREFEDRDPEQYVGRGDVKYHLGYHSEHLTPNGSRVQLSLCFNPSHLEYVNPVALGRTRALADRGRLPRSKKLTVLIHGDAALAGEGIVAETLNLSRLLAYDTGGAIHVVINNQIGFTTTPEQSRSCVYASDVAKTLDVPIFHVNGEDCEAVAQVVALAVDFREKFGRDVFIDMYGYRRHGHNEGDEPAFTQPLLCEAISRRKSVRDGYLEHLLRLGGVAREEAEQIALDRRQILEGELTEARRADYVRSPSVMINGWSGFVGGSESATPEVETALPAETLSALLLQASQLPAGFVAHRKVLRLLEQRVEMARGERKLDWGAGEVLAFASLLVAGTPIRMTGQDSERGTFSHRHAAVHHVETGEKHFPLAHLSPNQAELALHNSPLSEAAVLGFEYGFSLECPDWLVVWEAQFGDFFNVAQVIVDQFLVSAEDKWKQLSGLVLLLPHGYEGMGPEHSSARIERWMLLAAADNIQICQPSTPAQLFHLLRRQVLRRLRKPLIVFTPKSLLRHPQATSELSQLTQGTFERILMDTRLAPEETSQVRRVLLCTGKVYYALEQRREERGIRDVAILRVEQLYPLRDDALEKALSPFPSEVPVVWTQEEPANMGAWRYFRARFGERLLDRNPLRCVARAEAASPATGSANSHRLEQEQLLDRALGRYGDKGTHDD